MNKKMICFGVRGYEVPTFETLAEEYGYYVYNKSNTELKEAVDGALRELKENGTYDRLYEEWFSFVDEALQK